ncbi:concanavalin A-like lectin/glucanase superfamily protein [Thiogranum longum]|uniref:Concanavalin A-like lectin/glucanase superfamily protein n=1 Tax=Thiogranum longum TaxID=1537524 RepID=A0A4R1H5R7_9GAMM|nr:LamG domain-containing protein [Thiogranum longum]TCK17064.1 concanavalin A-like lectin/glucanase superfamily protein [Thiogranum longum]
MSTYSKSVRWGYMSAPGRVFRQIAVLMSVAILSACGGGAETSSNPQTSNGGSVGASSYTGPVAQTTDIREFQVNVWEPLRASNRCGACHVPGIQSPTFVQQDDVNQAYAEATPLVDLDVPASSRLVTKVAGGHNCWLTSDAACATIIQNYIEAWANGVSGGQREIQLTAPVIKDPGATKNFPGTSSDFTATVWPLLTANCAGCHVDSSPTAQSPFFASPVADDAYEAAKSKMDLNTPSNSRLVVRLRDEAHNCWTASCASDASDMQAAITAFANTVSPTVVNPSLVISKALTVGDGVVASGGSRYESDVIALYEFKSMSGNVAIDSSGVEPALHLTLTDANSWVGGWGIELGNGRRAQGSTTASKKLSDLIKATGEYSIEAWVAPANVTQEGPARIVSYSASTTARNFTLGQTQYNYDFLQRSSTTDGNGEPALSTADADEDLQATLQHVVVTFDPINGRRIYVNGVFTDDMDPVTPGNLTEWDDTFALVLGNEVSGDRQWAGQIRMLAIHNRALTQEQILQNFDVGVGEKFFLLFSIGDVIALPDSYIVFEVSQYDSYSYLFSKPFFINLDPAITPSSFPLQAMRIGINGREATVGQAWNNLNTVIGGAGYDPLTGQVLSDRGTIIALENGPASDEFFLTFEQLGSQSNAFTENSPLTPPDLAPPPVVSGIGVRTFDEVNASMASLTGVAPTVVQSSFQTLRQQLPAVESLDGFLSAHQMGIAQLSIEYCSALVDDPALRSTFFGAFGFTQDVSTAFGSGDSPAKNQVVNALYDKMIGLAEGASNDLLDAPTRDEVKTELIGYDLGGALANTNNLFDRLTSACPAGCDVARTQAIVKAMCGSALASAAVLVQ